MAGIEIEGRAGRLIAEGRGKGSSLPVVFIQSAGGNRGQASAARGVVRRIAALAGLWGPWIRRINGPYLSELSDAQLRDIGLSRIDVERPGA